MKVTTALPWFSALATLLWTAWAGAEPPAAAADAGSGAPASGAPESPKKPQIKMPEIEHFESAPYPAAAQAQGIAADVVLRLTIDAEGNVSAADVVQPAGNGFDEAAQAAALKFRFSPAERDGKAVPVQILYKYAFTLKEVKAATPEAAPTVGNLGGRIFIAATDVPLAGAKLMVTGPNQQSFESLTDAQGKWELVGLAPGSYSVQVSASGFQGLISKEDVRLGEATEITLRLVPEGEGLEVTVVGERPPREVTRRTLARREISRIPGTNGDALRSIQSLPGVARPPGLAGLLIVRGSAPQDTLTFIDGTEVPLIYHFGGLSSVIPTELLEKIDFYPGNFSARYGLASGGIVDVAIARPDTVCKDKKGAPIEGARCYHGLAQGDLIDTRFLLEGPVANSKTWSFAAAGRRSWVDVWLKPVLEQAGASVTSAPVYKDYQLVLHDQIDADTSWRLQAYGSQDELKLIIKDPSTQDPGFGGSLTLSTGFYEIQSIYKDQLTRNVRLESMFAVGGQNIGFSLGTFLFNLKVNPITLRNEFGFQLNPGMTLNVGMDFALLPFEVTVRSPPPPNPGEADPGPFATRPSLETHQKTTGFRPGWYTEFEWQTTKKLRVVPSVRFDYARDSGQTDVSPRLNARYELTGKTNADGSPGHQTILKGGVGVFHQPPQFQETDPVFGTPGIESNRSIHYAVGLERELWDHVDLSIEAFYKDKQNLVSRAPGNNGTFRYDNEGRGHAMGIETLFKYRADSRFFGWVAYTLSRSVLRDRPDQRERLFEYDQTHNLTMLGSYQLGRGWEFGSRFRVISGNLATPVVPEGLPALYAADAGSYAPLQADLYSRRLPLFHQLDIRVDKRWRFDLWTLSTYLDIQNVYNNQAVEALVYNYNFSQESFQTGLPLIPSLGLRGEF